MILASHIVQLLTYAAEELRLMSECGRHMEVHTSASDLTDLSEQIRSHVERSTQLRDRERMSAVLSAVAETFEVDTSRVVSPITAHQRRVRMTATYIADRVEFCSTGEVASRLGVAVGYVTETSYRVRAKMLKDRGYRDRIKAVTALLSTPSGDGHTGEITATDSRETGGGGRD